MASDLLALYDADERFSATFADTRREELPGLVRHVDLIGTSGAVIYSRLTADTVGAAIAEQIAYFTSLGQDFEWKAYAHDQPPDLAARLTALGFSPEETETILVLDLKTAQRPSAAPNRVKRITRRDELGDVVNVKGRVYTKDVNALVDRLAYELEHTPDGIGVYVAYVDDIPAACAWIRFPRAGAFASLWGGSTVPELRSRGLYSDLLNVRVQEAIGRGFRYLTIDASSMSRPIVEKHGFQVLTFATPCIWSTRAPQGG